MEKSVDDLQGVRRGDGSEAALDSGLRIVHSSIELCDAAKDATSPVPRPGEDTLDGDRQTETAMQHFHAGNLDKIKDAPPNTWATVDRRDIVTLSELARRGFHLVDMSGETWTMRRAG
jgi:hypothetical protein